MEFGPQERHTIIMEQTVVSISSDTGGTTMDHAPEQAPLNSSLQLRPHSNHKNHTPANILDQKRSGRTIETQPTNLDEVASTQDEAIEGRSSNKDTDEPQLRRRSLLFLKMA